MNQKGRPATCGWVDLAVPDLCDDPPKPTHYQSAGIRKDALESPKPISYHAGSIVRANAMEEVAVRAASPRACRG